MMAMDALLKAVVQKKNPSVLGLDTDYSYLPDAVKDSAKGNDQMERAAQAVFMYNCALVDALCDIVPAVKVQVAYYEKLGFYGMKAFTDTMRYAAQAGLVVIGDVKRNDIGTTAEAYANAYLGESHTGAGAAFPCDMITVNPYLGSDGIMPFVSYCKQQGKGIFVLVKTSNKSSGEFQDMFAEGRPVYMHVAQRVAVWGSECVGTMGYSSVGAVVGATYPEQGEELRAQMPKTCFLVPGYGAQGGKASDLPGMFDKNALGAVINASRSLICAYKKTEYEGMDYAEAARREALRMRDDIGSALSAAGKAF